MYEFLLSTFQSVFAISLELFCLNPAFSGKLSLN